MDFVGQGRERGSEKAENGESNTWIVGAAERPGIMFRHVPRRVQAEMGSGSARGGPSLPSVASVIRAETTSFVGCAENYWTTMAGARIFPVQSAIAKLPDDECGSVQHMLIDS